MSTGIVVVTGASGAFGRRAAEAFENAGWEVRRYKRGSDLAEIAHGADLIVNAMNPPMYHDWQGLLPQITAQVIDAAKATGATVLLPNNVYPYGAQPGPWTEATAQVPASRKGRIRQEVEATYRKAVAEDGIRVIALRMADFVDPANPATVLNMVVLKGLAKGRMSTLSPGAVVRAYAYLPDAARAAVALAEMRDKLPPWQEVNLPGLHFSMDQLRDEITRQTGRRPNVRALPWWIFRLAGPFHELSRELYEMRYLYRLDHRLESIEFDRLMPGFRFTPFDEVVREEIAAMAG